MLIFNIYECKYKHTNHEIYISILSNRNIKHNASRICDVKFSTDHILKNKKKQNINF